MTKQFVIDPQKRVDQHSRMSSELTKLLQASARMTLGLSGPAEEEVAIVENGLSGWRSILSKYYPCPDELSLLQLVGIHDSPLHKGWCLEESILSKELCQEICSSLDHMALSNTNFYAQSLDFQLKSLKGYAEAVSRINQHVQFIPSSISPDHQAYPWRSHIYEYDDASLSNRWHYDLEISDNIFFVMLFLEDSTSSGTAIYDHDVSFSISARDGYIGSPVAYRTSSLDAYRQINGYRKPFFVSPRTGNALVFMPSRCFHRGVRFPSNSYSFLGNHKRRVLHISYLVSSDKWPSPLSQNSWEKSLVETHNVSVPPYLDLEL